MHSFFTALEKLVTRNLRKILYCIIAVLLMGRLILIYSYNLDLDGAEFTFIHYIQQLLSGKKLYLNPEAYPFSAIIYSPVYLYIHAGLCRLFNIDYVNGVHSIFVIGRILSLSFVLLSVAYLYKILKRFNADKNQTILILCMFFMLITGHEYVCRPDSMKIAFFIIYLYYSISFLFFGKKKSDLFFLILSALMAIAAKQDAIVYIALFQFICLICIRKWFVLNYSILLLVLIVCLFCLFQLIFGSYCFISLFNFNLQVVTSLQFTYNILVILFTNSRMFPFYILFVYTIFFLPKTPHDTVLKIVSICGLCSAFISSFFLLRPGGFLNYTYELIVFSLLTLFIFIKTVKYPDWIKKSAFLYFPVILIVNPVLVNYSQNLFHYTELKQKYNAIISVRNKILPLINNNEILFTPDLELSLFFADKNVIYGHEYHLDRIIKAHLSLDCSSKLLLNSSDNYDAFFTNGKVKYILIENKENTQDIINSFYPDFHLLKAVDNYRLYEFTN